MNDTLFASLTRRALYESIEKLDSIKHLFLNNPEKDFTRERKITFRDFVEICLQMGSKSLQNELLEFFRYKPKTPSKSAFSQQRSKVLNEAMKYLFYVFTSYIQKIDSPKTFNGYRVLACDGSDINIPYDADDIETFHKSGDNRGYNQLHLNALYDILNGIYTDFVLEPDRKSHERAAFQKMVDRYVCDYPSIILADRGYEGYNVFAHLMSSGHHFVIRLKDPESNGILSTYEFQYDENGEFDCDIVTTLTHLQTNAIKSARDKYTFVARDKFDYFDEDHSFFPMELRILCISVGDGKYEYLATDLDRDEFIPSQIKELYHMRWNEETSFRDLKHTIGLLNFHSKKRTFVEQEAIARLIVFNFCSIIIHHIRVSEQSRQSKMRKHAHKIEFTTAVSICKEYLKTGSGEICRMICKYLTPIRPGRSSPRNVKPQSARPLTYRMA